MKYSVSIVFVVVVLCGFITRSEGLFAATDDAVVRADHDLVKALENSDSVALSKLVDADMTWIDAEGILRTREEALQVLPKPVVGSGSDIEIIRHSYDRVVLLQLHSGQAYALHIWVKQPVGWRLLNANEIILPQTPQSVKQPPAPIPCINPCKIVPFKPQTPAEQAALTSWQEMETGTEHNDAKGWGYHVADDSLALNSWASKPTIKSERVDAINKRIPAGFAINPNPVPLVMWMRMWDFGSAVVMLAEHMPWGAKPYIASRVWVDRDGRYQMAASYHNEIKAMPPVFFTTTAPE